MRRPYPTVHVEHEGSVPFPSGLGSRPTLERGHLPLKSSMDNSHQAFKSEADPALGHELEIQCVMPASIIAVFMSSVIRSSSASAT